MLGGWFRDNFLFYAFLYFSNFCKICTKYIFPIIRKTYNDHNHSIHRITQEFFSAFQILKMRPGRTIKCFSSPYLENFSRNSMGSEAFLVFFICLMIFCTLSRIRGILQIVLSDITGQS